MPELPEVETIRTQLADKLIGRKIVDVEVRLPKIWQGEKKDVVGAKITDVQRRAKILILKLSNGKNIVVHLKMTGQLIYSDGTSFPTAKTTRVILDLDKGKLFFNDMRQFGWMRVLDNGELKKIDEKHGPDALGEDFTLEYLAKILSNWGRPVKLLLLDQSKIAGVGNIYANEALWCAKISPMKRGREVKNVAELHRCIREVLEKGLKYGGSSAADEAFVNVLGKKGHMQEHFNVYQKQKTPCLRCGATITVSRIGGRGTFFCPKCQK